MILYLGVGAQAAAVDLFPHAITETWLMRFGDFEQSARFIRIVIPYC